MTKVLDPTTNLARIIYGVLGVCFDGVLVEASLQHEAKATAQCVRTFVLLTQRCSGKGEVLAVGAYVEIKYLYAVKSVKGNDFEVSTEQIFAHPR